MPQFCQIELNKQEKIMVQKVTGGGNSHLFRQSCTMRSSSQLTPFFTSGQELWLVTEKKPRADTNSETELSLKGRWAQRGPQTRAPRMELEEPSQMVPAFWSRSLSSVSPGRRQGLVQETRTGQTGGTIFCAEPWEVWLFFSRWRMYSRQERTVRVRIKQKQNIKQKIEHTSLQHLTGRLRNNAELWTQTLYTDCKQTVKIN